MPLRSTTTMEEERLDLNDQPNNNNGDFIEPSDDHLPDPDQVSSEWGNLEDDISEEPIDNDEDPFATMPINNIHQNEYFTLEDIISQIFDCNDPMITTPMDIEIEENEIQIVAIYGAFQDNPDPPSDQFPGEDED